MSRDHLVQFQKEKTALKYYLIGRNYHQALRALGFAERYHVGLRKDGKTPELHHQVQIALSVTQQKNVLNEEQCIVAALLHDVQEDYQIPTDVLREEFGSYVADTVWRLTKKFAGTSKDKKAYIEAIAGCADSSIVKGLDRLNNLQSMIGVFSISKMEDYANEASELFLPMLKKASKLFPAQQAAYHSISQQIKQIVRLVHAYVELDRKYVNQPKVKDASLLSRADVENIIAREVEQIQVTNNQILQDHIKLNEQELQGQLKTKAYEVYGMIARLLTQKPKITNDAFLEQARVVLNLSVLEVQLYEKGLFSTETES